MVKQSGIIKKQSGEQYNSFIEELQEVIKSGLSITDSHTHIHFAGFGKDYQVDKIIKTAKNYGVKRAINIGTTYEDSINMSKFINNVKNIDNEFKIYGAIGIHPNHATEINNEQLKEIAEHANDDDIIAIGEIGLDYYRNDENDIANIKVQKDVFINFIELANNLKKPILIHSRDAHADIISTLKDFSKPRDNHGIIHCFSGDLDLLRYALDNGFYISYPGVITYPSAAALRDTIKFVPLDRVLIESDAPFLTPSPHRGEINQPALVPFTAKVLATEYNMSFGKIIEQLETNFNRLFSL